MYLSLSPSMLGIKSSLQDSIALAAKHRFAGVDTNVLAFKELDSEAIHRLTETMQAAGVRPGAAVLTPGRIPAPQDEWAEGVAALPHLCANARAAGFERILLVVLPFHETLEREAALDELVKQLNGVLPILADHGQRLGLEYVAAPSRREAYTTHTIWNLAGMLELLERLPGTNAGLLLDSFHWHGAAESDEDLKRLKNEQVVGVHLNDAPPVPLNEQKVMERALPGHTGEIDLQGFLSALRAIGYDGPLTCEPMPSAISALQATTDDDIVHAVSESMHNVLAASKT